MRTGANITPVIPNKYFQTYYFPEKIKCVLLIGLDIFINLNCSSITCDSCDNLSQNVVECENLANAKCTMMSQWHHCNVFIRESFSTYKFTDSVFSYFERMLFLVLLNLFYHVTWHIYIIKIIIEHTHIDFLKVSTTVFFVRAKPSGNKCVHSWIILTILFVYLTFLSELA